jgi:transposase-like protein
MVKETRLETFVYVEFHRKHWRWIRSNNPVERFAERLSEGADLLMHSHMNL